MVPCFYKSVCHSVVMQGSCWPRCPSCHLSPFNFLKEPYLEKLLEWTTYLLNEKEINGWLFSIQTEPDYLVWRQNNGSSKRYPFLHFLNLGICYTMWQREFCRYNWDVKIFLHYLDGPIFMITLFIGESKRIRIREWQQKQRYEGNML